VVDERPVDGLDGVVDDEVLLLQAVDDRLERRDRLARAAAERMEPRLVRVVLEGDQVEARASFAYSTFSAGTIVRDPRR
jgi:hypothetical protein